MPGTGEWLSPSLSLRFVDHDPRTEPGLLKGRERGLWAEGRT